MKKKNTFRHNRGKIPSTPNETRQNLKKAVAILTTLACIVSRVLPIVISADQVTSRLTAPCRRVVTMVMFVNFLFV